MPAIFCKAVKCQWNKSDEQNQKYRCNKLLVFIETDGYCQTGSVRKTQTPRRNDDSPKKGEEA